MIGREFDVDALVEMSPLDEEDVFAVLDEAVAAGLVGDAPEASGLASGSQNMTLRHALYDGLYPAPSVSGAAPAGRGWAGGG